MMLLPTTFSNARSSAPSLSSASTSRAMSMKRCDSLGSSGLGAGFFGMVRSFKFLRGRERIFTDHFIHPAAITRAGMEQRAYAQDKDRNERQQHRQPKYHNDRDKD